MTSLSVLVGEFNFTNTLVIITFLYALYLRAIKKGYPLYLLVLLALGFLNEGLSIANDYFSWNIVLFNDLYVICHHLIWLLLLRQFQEDKRLVNLLIASFFIFSITEMLVLRQKNYICYSFVIGSLFYLVLFFNENFKQLKKEKFDFIFSNYFLLLSAPILFFLGMSLMFAFVERKIRTTLVLSTFSLYEIVNYFTNLIYYVLILIYLYRQGRLQYERI